MTEFEESILEELKEFEKNICEKITKNSWFHCSECPFEDGVYCNLRTWKAKRNIE